MHDYLPLPPLIDLLFIESQTSVKSAGSWARLAKARMAEQVEFFLSDLDLLGSE